MIVIAVVTVVVVMFATAAAFLTCCLRLHQSSEQLASAKILPSDQGSHPDLKN